MNTPGEKTELFFFWLVLENKLDEHYYAAAHELAQLGVKLLPVKLDQVSRLAALTDAGHVMVLCSTRHGLQYEQFRKQVAPVLPMLLRQERVSFFHFSSFQKLDLGTKVYRQKNYFFLKYPLNMETLCVKLKRFHDLRLNRARVWPGGRRAKVPGLAA